MGIARLPRIGPRARRLAHRQRRVLLAVGAASAAAGLLLLVLGPVSWLIAGDTVRGLPGKERADAINAVRQTVLTAIGGAAVSGGLLFTARTYRLSKRGQVTERFNGAISLLASERLEERLGAIYSLEHVLAESPQDHLSVVNLLAHYVKNRTRPVPLPDTLPGPRSDGQDMPAFGIEPEADIEAALRVLAVRPDRPEPFRLDLRYVTLPGIYLRSMEFSRPPSFRLALFTWADLRAASFRGMDFTGAIFTNADLRKCHLSEAKLDGALLARADLRGALWTGATLTGAFLDGADLRDCATLTAEQLSAAWLDGSTKLPSHLADDAWVRARVAACEAAGSPRPVPPATPEPR